MKDMDVVQTGSHQLLVHKVLDVLNMIKRHALIRKSQDLVQIIVSSGSLTPHLETAHDSGMAAVRATRIDLTHRKIVKLDASIRLDTANVSCPCPLVVVGPLSKDSTTTWRQGNARTSCTEVVMETIIDLKQQSSVKQIVRCHWAETSVDSPTLLDLVVVSTSDGTSTQTWTSVDLLSLAAARATKIDSQLCKPVNNAAKNLLKMYVRCSLTRDRARLA